MSTLTLSGIEDFTGQTLTGIDRIVVQDSARATFDASQFGGAGIASDVRLVYGGALGAGASVISINGGSVDLSGWTFVGWPADGHWRLSIDIQGTAGNDLITGSSWDDIIDGHGGNDVLSGGAGNDQIYLGKGYSIVYGGAGNDVIDQDFTQGYFVATAFISTGTGNDSILGDYKSSHIVMGSGDDFFAGTLSNSTISTGDGNDNITLAEGPGPVNIATGAGDDGVHIENFSYRTMTITANLGAGDDNCDIDTRAAVTIAGGDGNDSFRISTLSQSVIVSGGAGADWLSATGWSDLVFRGGLGNDTIYADQVDAGTIPGKVNIDGGQGDDQISVMTAAPCAVDVSGGSGDDTISVSLAAGSIGIVSGGTGNDTITITGSGYSVGPFSITVDGGAGDDTISGGSGDTFIGGAGHDTFVIVGSSAAAPVVIDDFLRNADVVDLQQIDADGSGGAFTFVGTAAFSHTAGELRFEQLGGHTFVYGDTNGDGVADLVIDFVGSINFHASDFVL